MTSSFNQNVRLPLCLRDASDLRPVAEEVLRLGLGLTHLYPYYRFLVPHAYCYHIFYLYATKPCRIKQLTGIEFCQCHLSKIQKNHMACAMLV